MTTSVDIVAIGKGLTQFMTGKSTQENPLTKPPTTGGLGRASKYQTPKYQTVKSCTSGQPPDLL